MKLIKIIRGTYGHKEGNVTIAKTFKDEPFGVDEEIAKRLVENKVAEEIAISKKLPPNPPGDPNDYELPKYNKNMNRENLTATALIYGLDKAVVDACENKKDIIALIDKKIEDDKKNQEAFVKGDEGKNNEGENINLGENSDNVPNLGDGTGEVTQ